MGDFQNGPLPMQEVVVMAVRAAVMAATMTFRMISQTFLFFMATVFLFTFFNFLLFYFFNFSSIEVESSVNFDLRSRLLLLGIAQTGLALLSLNRSLLFRSLERGHSLFLSLPYQGLLHIPALP